MTTSPSEPKQRRVFRRWSAAELDQLQELAGNMLSQDITQHFNKWAASNGLRPRTHRGILYAMKTYNISPDLIGDKLTMVQVKTLLNVCNRRISRWIRQGYLPSRRVGPFRIIRRAHLKRMAINHPELFTGIKYDRLFVILEDEQLAKSIASKYPVVKNRPKRVRCLETGQVFPSISFAAKRLHVVQRSLAQAVRTGSRCCGRHWEAA